jgi:hypothetical protein
MKAFLAFAAAAVVGAASPGRRTSQSCDGVSRRLFVRSELYLHEKRAATADRYAYHLRDNFRYVNDNGYVYMVNPHTYRVVRVTRAPM